MSPSGHRGLRALLFLVIAGSVGLAVHRLRRTDDQVELTRYVERDLPPLVVEERGVADGLAQLLADKKLPPADARHRLVDELTPRLVRLRHRAEALQPTTLTVRTLAAEYLRVVDGWTEAARTAARAIDDPKISTEGGLVAVRERLSEAAATSQQFKDHLVATCRMHRLAPPTAERSQPQPRP